MKVFDALKLMAATKATRMGHTVGTWGKLVGRPGEIVSCTACGRHTWAVMDTNPPSVGGEALMFTCDKRLAWARRKTRGEG